MHDTGVILEVYRMASNYRRLSWLLRWAVKVFVRWLIKEMLEELREGILVKVTIDGRVYWLLIQLQANAFRAAGKVIVDGD